MMKRYSISKLLAILLMLCGFMIVSCEKAADPNSGNDGVETPIDSISPNDPEIPVNPDGPDGSNHPVDNGYAKIRVEMTSNYKEMVDLRYYQFSFSVIGQCSNADRNVKDRTTESINSEPWVYETEFPYHGDETVTIFLTPEYNGDLSGLDLEQLQSLHATIKLYYNDELVDTGDRMVVYLLPYADY